MAIKKNSAGIEVTLFNVVFSGIQILLSGAIGIAITEIKDISSSLKDLNTRVAVSISEMNNQKQEFQNQKLDLKQLEVRIRNLEEKTTKYGR